MMCPGEEAEEKALFCEILLAGGHAHILGGLEMFIARARACLGIEAHIFTETPSGWKTLPRFFHALLDFVRKLASCEAVWLQYGSVFDLVYLLLAKLCRRKVVVTPHLGGSWRSMQNPVLRSLCNRSLFLADAIFLLYRTQPDALRFPEALKRRCIVMPTFLPSLLLGTSEARATPKSPLRLAHVARLSAAKGSFAFLEVCAQLKQRSIAFEATIVGSGGAEFDAQLAEEIKRRDLSITMLGILAQDELIALFRRQDVLVNLSVQDAYPLTVIEAALCGMAAVCTALPGTKELAFDAPIIVLAPGQDAKVAADRIQEIDWQQSGPSMDTLRERFGWTAVASRYRAVFRDRILLEKSMKASAP